MILRKRGFTLIEIVVVMAIIAVLAALVVGAIGVARKTAKETTHRANARNIRAGVEAYYSREKHYPYSGTSSFQTINTINGGLGVTLSDTPECTGKRINNGTVWVNIDGGGYVYQPNSNVPYEIHVVNHDCTEEMTGDAAIW